MGEVFFRRDESDKAFRVGGEGFEGRALGEEFAEAGVAAAVFGEQDDWASGWSGFDFGSDDEAEAGRLDFFVELHGPGDGGAVSKTSISPQQIAEPTDRNGVKYSCSFHIHSEPRHRYNPP